MASVPEAYALAVRHHREGRLQNAEPLYRQIIEADPGHGGAWYHLGVVSNQLSNPRAAVECFELRWRQALPWPRDITSSATP